MAMPSPRHVASVPQETRVGLKVVSSCRPCIQRRGGHCRHSLLHRQTPGVEPPQWRVPHPLRAASRNSGSERGGGTSTTAAQPAASCSSDDERPDGSAPHHSPTLRPRGSGPPPDPDPKGPPEQQPEGLPFRLRYLVLLLAEYGGLYGTAAVLFATLTRVDAFGGLHWDTGHVTLGLELFLPVLLFDAVIGIPDWSARPEDTRKLLRLFVDGELLSMVTSSSSEQSDRPEGDPSAPSASAPHPTSSPSASSSGSAASSTPGGCAAKAAPPLPDPTVAVLAIAQGGSPGAGPSSVTPPPGPPGEGRRPALSAAVEEQPSALWMVGQRVRMAFELLQAQYIRNNPSARLTVPQELLVTLVAVLADEMLYRAVVLTLFSLWLRDRFYEGGADDVMGLPLLGLDLPTGEAAQWAALAIGVGSGAAVFGLNAWRESSLAHNAAAAAAAMSKKASATARLEPSGAAGSAAETQALIAATKASLAASIGIQGTLVWVLEGAREMTQVASAGAAFILTGNLAAPLAGSLLTQMLFSIYQRRGMQRSLERRIAILQRRKAKAATANPDTDSGDQQ